MRVASLRDRLLAGLVDAAVAVFVIAAAIGMGIAGAAAYERIRGRDEDEDEDELDLGELDEDEPEDDEQDSGPLDARTDADGRLGRGDWSRAIEYRTFPQSSLVHAAVQGAATGVAFASRNTRSPGFRVVGLRRVDARTGGPVSAGGYLIGLLFDQTRQALITPLFRARAQRKRERLKELEPKRSEIERKYANDREACRRALGELYEANEVKLTSGCWWPVAGPVLSQLVLAALTRDGRTIHDRVTGTIVVMDR